MKLLELKKDIRKLANAKKAKSSAWFFKTGEGDYGYGDKFIGIIVPIQRQIARKFIDLDLNDIEKLLKSDIHEHRFIALEILVMKFERADKILHEKIAKFYLKNTKRVNNWDLVDTSAPYILGKYLLDKPRQVLYKLAESKDLWERRIAIVSTQELIRNGQFKDTIALSEILMDDTHDLIQKAMGWMLREMGKKDVKILVRFLNKHARHMPRTMLRYSIEKFPEKTRKYYLKKKHGN